MKAFMALIVVIVNITFTMGQKTFEFTIEGMTCQGCVDMVTKTLENVDGVVSVLIDLDSKHAMVVAESNVAEADLREAIHANTNFEALFEGEKLPQPLTEKEEKGLDIKVITGGAKIKLKDHLARGKLTIFDFYAEWCGPCKVFSPKLERLLLEQPNLALRKVDVVDWKSALANQLTKDYNLPALPFTVIFDEHGNFLGKVEGNNIEEVQKIIESK